MKKQLFLKVKEALISILPIVGIVFFLCLTIVDVPYYSMIAFLIGATLLIIGMIFFTLGTDLSMIKIGELVGSYITKSKSIILIALICFTLGLMITIAEPDLRVLADSIPMIDSKILIITVSIGVGIFLVISFFRVYLQIKISYILIIMYTLLFILALSPYIPTNFVALAFDSGGVTTGPITVPFIMALGIGLASVRGDQTSEEDSFGLVALCSIGPILTVLLLSLFFKGDNAIHIPNYLFHYQNLNELFANFKATLLLYLLDVAIALLPIILFFIIFNVIKLKLKLHSFIKVCVGLIYTYLGLVLFLTGVNIGFMSIGYIIGYQIADSSLRWFLIPLGALIGYFIVAAEPAVHILKQQVEDITEGHITGKMMGSSLAIGIALSVAFAMLRTLTGLSIWYILIPCYIFSLIMTLFVPPIFTSIAFDSGGVASGPMTATFLLPLAMGSCQASGNIPFTDAFGIIAFVAMTPLVTIQLLGLIHKIKAKSSTPPILVSQDIILSDEIIEYDISKED